MSDEGHVPGQINNELPDPIEQPEAPAPESTPETPAPKPEEETPEAPQPPKPEEGKPEDTPEEPPQQPTKPRSIYQDLKDERGKRKDAETRATEAEAKVAELKALLEKRNDAETPAQEHSADEELDAFAKEQGLDSKSLTRLIEVVSKRIPQSGLSDEEKQLLASAKEWQTSSKRSQEDQAILSEAPQIREQLKELGSTVHDETEFQAVMAEITRLAHTKQYHDKPVDYIVWANRKDLTKLISPKKASFEQGGQPGEAPPGSEPDFSASGVTPGMAQEAMTERGRSPGYEIRGGRK